MDAFESIIATILQREGFWVRTSFKVELTKEEKQSMNRPSTPRWEIDVLAYRPGDNTLRVVECKSFLDSYGVAFRGFKPGTTSKRYKLFNEPETREIVLGRLVSQLLENRSIQPNPTVQLCLAAGKIAASSASKVRAHFQSNNWLLLEPDWIRDRLVAMADDGYENSIAAVTAKLLLRKST